MNGLGATFQSAIECASPSPHQSKIGRFVFNFFKLRRTGLVVIQMEPVNIELRRATQSPPVIREIKQQCLRNEEGKHREIKLNHALARVGSGCVQQVVELARGDEIKRSLPQHAGWAFQKQTLQSDA